MVRVWLRPALAALRQQAAKNVSAHASARQALLAHQHFISVRQFASKKDKGYQKKSIHDKIEDVDDDLTVLPPDVEFLAKDKSLEPELMQALLEEEFGDMEIGDDDDDSDDDDDDDDDEDDDDDDLDEDELAQLEKLLAEREDGDEEDFLNEDGSELTDVEWAANYERDLASMNTGSNKEEVVDDRLFIEMPHFDPSMTMASDEMYDSGDEDDDGDDDEEYDSDEDDDDSDDEDDTTPDPFEQWDQSSLYTPEMLNWMLPADKRQPFTKKKDKPWKYFVRANHPDPVELALDVDLLRLFISPTGRIRPRRYTGLTAKQQRQLARSVKISRQMALLPYLSRYPEPSPEQWRAMEDDIIAKHLAEVEKNGDTYVDDDDDDEDDAEFADMDDE